MNAGPFARGEVVEFFDLKKNADFNGTHCAVVDSRTLSSIVIDCIGIRGCILNANLRRCAAGHGEERILRMFLSRWIEVQ